MTPRGRPRNATGQFVATSPAPNLFLWGAGGLMLSLVLVFAYPIFGTITPLQVAVVAVLVSLSGALIASAIAAVLRLETRFVKATGPFVIVGAGR